MARSEKTNQTDEPNYFSVENYRFDHAEALLTLDEKIIRASCKKWGIIVSDQADKFWTAVHRAIAFMPNIADSEKVFSRNWLTERKVNRFSTEPLAL